MKIGVSSYSFSRLVKSGQMKQIDVIAKAKEMGCECIEFAGFEVPEGKTAIEFAKELRAEADRLEMPITNYTIGADVLAGSNGNLEAEIERVKKEVDIAEILGCPGMRHDCTYGRFPADWQGAKTFAAALPRLAAGCRAITEYAASKGIRTMIENHGQFCQESLRVEQLITAVNHENFGLLLDMGNFTCADDDPVTAVGRLQPYVFHVHAKDFHMKPGSEPCPGKGWFASRSCNWLRGAIIGHGNVKIAQCVRILLSKGYDGVLSIEFEGMEDPLMGIPLGLENLKRFVEMAKA